MGMLELDEKGTKRKEQFLETYLSLKNESKEMAKMNSDDKTDGESNEETQNQIKPYIYGSNYSNPFYTCNFLILFFLFYILI